MIHAAFTEFQTILYTNFAVYFLFDQFQTNALLNENKNYKRKDGSCKTSNYTQGKINKRQCPGK